MGQTRIPPVARRTWELKMRRRNERDLPSEFSMTLGLFDSITATQELVVPKSIPMVLKKTRLAVCSETECRRVLATGH